MKQWFQDVGFSAVNSIPLDPTFRDVAGLQAAPFALEPGLDTIAIDTTLHVAEDAADLWLGDLFTDANWLVPFPTTNNDDDE